MCTASVHNTTQNSFYNLPSYHQTNIIAQMLSIGGEGVGEKRRRGKGGESKERNGGDPRVYL